MHRLATIHSVQRNTTDLYATLYQYKLTVKDRQTENDSEANKTSDKGAMADRESLKWICESVSHENV